MYPEPVGEQTLASRLLEILLVASPEEQNAALREVMAKTSEDREQAVKDAHTRLEFAQHAKARFTDIREGNQVEKAGPSYR